MKRSIHAPWSHASGGDSPSSMLSNFSCDGACHFWYSLVMTHWVTFPSKTFMWTDLAVPWACVLGPFGRASRAWASPLSSGCCADSFPWPLSVAPSRTSQTSSVFFRVYLRAYLHAAPFGAFRRWFLAVLLSLALHAPGGQCEAGSRGRVMSCLFLGYGPLTGWFKGLLRWSLREGTGMCLASAKKYSVVTVPNPHLSGKTVSLKRF